MKLLCLLTCSSTTFISVRIKICRVASDVRIYSLYDVHKMSLKLTETFFTSECIYRLGILNLLVCDDGV
jgi:hypothetical protein